MQEWLKHRRPVMTASSMSNIHSMPSRMQSPWLAPDSMSHGDQFYHNFTQLTTERWNLLSFKQGDHVLRVNSVCDSADGYVFRILDIDPETKYAYLKKILKFDGISFKPVKKFKVLELENRHLTDWASVESLNAPFRSRVLGLIRQSNSMRFAEDLESQIHDLYSTLSKDVLDKLFELEPVFFGATVEKEISEPMFFGATPKKEEIQDGIIEIKSHPGFSAEEAEELDRGLEIYRTRKLLGI